MHQAWSIVREKLSVETKLTDEELVRVLKKIKYDMDNETRAEESKANWKKTHYVRQYMVLKENGKL